jgi:Tfp pilus assembly protein PilF
MCAARTAGGFAMQAASKEQQTGRLIEEGIAALERGNEAAAKAAFQRVLKVEAGNVTAHTYLGVIADRAGDLAQAERHFATAVKADPKSPAALNNYGAVLLRQGLVTQAAVQFEASLRLDARQSGALVNLAQIRFGAGTPESLEAARVLFEKAHAIAPEAEIARALVVVALRLKDSGAAAGYYRDYLSRLPTAGEPTRSAASRGELGAALLEAGLAAEASDELKAAVEADPANVNAILQLARAELARKDIAAAGRTLEGAVARGLEAAPIYAALAEVYELSGHVENAIPAMRFAIERDPNSEAYRFRYAMLLTDTKAPAAAVIRLEEALKLFPQSARLRFALGVAKFTDRKLDAAARDLERAVELDQKFAPAQAYLGVVYAEQGRFAEAIPLYEKALSIDERLGVTHYLLADALLKLPSGDAARAEQHLSRAISLDPSLTLARLAFSRLLLRTNRVPEAVSQLEQVTSAAPNLAEAYYQLGRAYQRLKRTKEAEASFATFKHLSDNQTEQMMSQQREIARRLANVRF